MSILIRLEVKILIVIQILGNNAYWKNEEKLLAKNGKWIIGERLMNFN